MGDAEETHAERKHAAGRPDDGRAGAGGHAELEQLRRAMETRPVIDQAHGVLMAAYRCSPDDAWDVLVAVSQHTNTKLHKVASALVDSTQGEPLPEPLSSALHSALRTTPTTNTTDEAGQGT